MPEPADLPAPLPTGTGEPGGTQTEDREWDSALRCAFAPGGFGGDSVVMQSIELRAGRRVQVALRALAGDATPLRLQPRAVDWTGGGAGRYSVRGEIARGGVGIVLLAHDNDLGRDIAVKVLHEEHADHPAMIQRFVEEAQIGGQLQHPGIVPVYELGLDLRQRPYFTMKLVQGETLAAWLDRRVHASDDQARLLATFARVCETVAFAHARGVVHRDLKPANVMVGEFGEVLVMDWGFAKVLGRGEHAASAAIALAVDTSASVAGTILGTPAYMPPEQAAGDIERLDASADVFALGAILCQILTGRPPYLGEKVLEQARTGLLEPAHARLRDCGADPHLCAIAAQCLQRDPAARPRAATELSTALADHFASLDARAEEARVEAATAQARAREERARRRLVVALACAALALASVGAWLYRSHERRVESTAQEVNAALAAAWQRTATGDLAAALVAVDQARTALRAGTPDSAVARAVQDAEDRLRRMQREQDVECALLEALLGGGAEVRAGSVETAAVLRDLGVDLGAAPAEIAARVRALGQGAPALVTRVVHELALRTDPRRSGGLALDKLLAAGDALDDDVARRRVRALWAAQDATALRELRARADLDADPIDTLELLGMALLHADAQSEGITVLAAAYDRAPGDFWINNRLASAYRAAGRFDDAELHRGLAWIANPLRRFGIDPPMHGPGARGRPPGPPGGGRRRGH